MSTTTAFDLLDLADRQTRLLRDTDVAATREQWESFDVTLHRLLLELTGAGGAYVRSQDPSLNALTMAVRTYPQPLRCPPGTQLGTREVSAYLGASPTTVLRQVRSGRLQAIKIDDVFRYSTSSIETRPDIRPADPTDPHPLARTACALGAMADLIRDSRDNGPAVLPNDGEAAGAAVHVLSLAAVAARHTIAHGPFYDVARPVAVGRYAERAIDGLRDQAVQPVSLHHLASIHPAPAPVTLNDRLEATLHAWQASARQEIHRLIPSVDVLRQIANQGAHVCAVRAQLGHVSGEQANYLRDSAHALSRGEKAWRSLTTLSRPSHEFVTASRELFETLATVENAAKQPTLDARRAKGDLDRGLGAVSHLMALTRSLPEQLLTANVLRGPATSLGPADDRLQDRVHGRYVQARHTDAAELVTAWELATRSMTELPYQATRDRSVQITL